MEETEFDRFAEEYRQIHRSNIKVSGEDPEFFAEYKVRDVAGLLQSTGTGENVRILDFGCGVGNSVPHFVRHLQNCELVCLDVSKKSLRLAEERFPDVARYVSFDGTHIPFPDGHFDVVFSACVFHHIPHSEHPALLRELHRVLRSGGTAIIFEHNPFNPLTVRAVNTCAFDENAVLLSAGNLANEMSAAGFDKPQCRYRIFFPGPLRAFRIFEPYLAWLPLGAQYYVAAHKHPIT